MADNMDVTPGAGKTVAADDVGGVLYQRIKLSLGADGAAVDAVAGAGAVSSGVQRVTLASDDPAVSSLGRLDDWMDGDACKVVGNTPHDSIDAGNPLKIGGKARTSTPTAVANDDRVDGLFDKFGRQIVGGSLREQLGIQKTTITSNTSEVTIVTAAGADIFADLYGLIISNSSATSCTVTIKEATTGATRFVLTAEAGKNTGFMLPVDSAIPQSAANSNWTATCSGSVSSIEITAMFVKNK